MAAYFCPKKFPAHAYDFYQVPHYPHLGLYESHYLKANSPDGKLALWIKHNLLSFGDSRRDPLVELWCILFERDHEPQVMKQVLSLREFTSSPQRLELKGPQVLLTENSTQTKIQSQKGEVSWAIQIQPAVQPAMIFYRYAAMYSARLPKKKILTPVPESHWQGWLQWNDRRISIENWTGFRGHNWGTEHAFAYAYGNCNLFKNAPGVYFDGFSASIKMMGLKTPWLSGGVLRIQENDVPMNGLLQSLLTPARVEFPVWEAEWKASGESLKIRQSAPPEDFVGLIYHHPNGKVSYCYNTKFARTDLIYSGRYGNLSLQSELGELEFLFDKPLDGIRLHGD